MLPHGNIMGQMTLALGNTVQVFTLRLSATFAVKTSASPFTLPFSFHCLTGFAGSLHSCHESRQLPSVSAR